MRSINIIIINTQKFTQHDQIVGLASLNLYLRSFFKNRSVHDNLRYPIGFN